MQNRIHATGKVGKFPAQLTDAVETSLEDDLDMGIKVHRLRIDGADPLRILVELLQKL